MSSEKQKEFIWLGCALGGGYGIFARFIFSLDRPNRFFAVMSASFIFLIPLVIGFVTVWFNERKEKLSLLRRIFAPWSSVLACLLCCLLFAWEGIICIFLWLPLVLILSSIGGLVAGWLRLLFPDDRSKNYCFIAIALLPFIAAPLESFRKQSSEIRTVKTSIEIHATPEVVWREIRSVPKIKESEQSFSLSHLLGLPRPIEAVLEGEGVGAVRYARFEGNVLFIERVTAWVEQKQLDFSIQADTKNIPPTTFDEHVTIGGRYFDVLKGSYWIEPLSSDRVILHLSSDQRLSTGFNFYSHLWTEALMADLQNYILQIIKKRCESP